MLHDTEIDMITIAQHTEAGEEAHQAPQEPETLDGRVETSR